MPDAVESDAGKPDDVQSDDVETEKTADENAGEPEFLNRAARRAKGKKHGRSDGNAANTSQPHGRGAVQVGRKQFGNRRTGG